MKIINESRIPEVGPFYVIDNVVFADTEEIRDIESRSNGFKDSDNSHYDYWEVLKSIYPEFRDHDYDYYPRGRVVYNSSEDKYFIFVDRCLRDDNSIDSIVDELNLPRNKISIQDDEHYQCHQCNSDYVDLAENFE